MSLIDSASLIVTPNAYKEGKLYSVIPSDGSGDLSVTRATTATRVNSAGLVELVPYNLLTWSEQFDNAAYLQQATTITANAAISPSGVQNADKLIPTTTNGPQHIVAQTSAVSNATLYTASCYIKAAEYTGAYLRDGYSGKFVVFNLSTGVISSTSSATGTIEDVGNGWYRCTATMSSVTTLFRIDIGVLQNGSQTVATSYAGDGTSGIFIWGAQLVEGSVAKDYQKTETRLNIPRLDYSNGTCPSILVEPQRTNLLTNSSSFDNAAWTKLNVSVTANDATAPDGTLTADKITNSSLTNDRIQQLQIFGSSGARTISLYAKAGTANLLKLQAYDDTTDFTGTFDLSSGSVVSTSSGVTASILPSNNDWYRLTISFNSSTTAIYYQVLFELQAGTRYIWGAQLEAGSYPTSLIQTQGSTVTRNADVISKTGISSLIGQTEGTLFVDFYVDNLSSQTNAPVIFSFNANNYIEIFDDGRVQYYDGSGNIIIDLPSYGLTNGRHKFAIAYNTNDVAFYIDGALAGTDTSCTPSAKSSLYLGYTDLSFLPKLDYNAAALWQTRLTNTQLAQLTTI